jgi:hypothetical protein
VRQPLKIDACASIIEVARRFTLAAVLSLSLVIWIDILHIAWELSGVAAEVTHLTISKTPANKNGHQLEPRQPRPLQRLISRAQFFTPTG